MMPAIINLPPETRIELAWDEDPPNDDHGLESIERETTLVRELFAGSGKLDGLPVDFIEKHIKTIGRRNARIRAGLPLYFYTMESIEKRRTQRKQKTEDQ